MAKKTVVATLKKRDKKRPLAYVDKKGSVRHFRRGQRKRQHAVLAKGIVSKDLLKQRRAMKILLYVRGKKVMKVKSALSGKRRGRKARGRKGKTRRRGRKARGRKGKKGKRYCPKVKKGRRVSKRAALLCLLRKGPGRWTAVHRKAAKALGGKRKAMKLVRAAKARGRKRKGTRRRR